MRQSVVAELMFQHAPAGQIPFNDAQQWKKRIAPCDPHGEQKEIERKLLVLTLSRAYGLRRRQHGAQSLLMQTRKSNLAKRRAVGSQFVCKSASNFWTPMNP